MESRWDNLREGAPYLFGLLQVDIVGSSGWPAPEIHQQQTKANLRRYLRSLGEGVFDVRELAWSGDGGSYYLRILDPKEDYDRLVHCALHMLQSLETFSRTPILDLMGFPIVVRVSCHAGLVHYAARPAELHSGALNYFLKNERQLGYESTVTITEEVYCNLVDSQLKSRFQRIEPEGYTIGEGRRPEALYRAHKCLSPRSDAPGGEFDGNLDEAPAAKRAVADYVVANFVGNASHLLLDTGTSAHAVAEAIVRRWRSGAQHWSSLTIQTHNYPAWRSLQQIPDDILDLWLIGGRFDSSLNAFFAPLALIGQGLAAFCPTVSVMAVNGICGDNVYFCSGREEHDVKRLLATTRVTEARVILAHQGKIGKSAGFRFLELRELFGIDGARVVVITNKPAGGVESSYEGTRSFIRKEYGEAAFVEV